jgi:curved DNA-binding protein CbpA
MKIESMKAIDPFAILGIERGASMPEIRQAWLDQLQAWHPDRFDKESSIYATADEKTKLINAAFDMLKASGGAAPPPQPQPEPEPDDEVNWDDEPGQSAP